METYFNTLQLHLPDKITLSSNYFYNESFESSSPKIITLGNDDLVCFLDPQTEEKRLFDL